MKDLIKLFLPPIIFNALRKYSIYRLRKKKITTQGDGGKVKKLSNVIVTTSKIFLMIFLVKFLQ